MLNLDTHILIKALQGNLTARERVLLERDGEWCISGIVLWEIHKLHEIGRIAFGLDYPPLSEALQQVEVVPVNGMVCRSLASLDFHSDPADEFIGATSIAYQIPLLTRDDRILRSRIIRFP